MNATLDRTADDMYTSERYLELTGGTWHVEDSASKAKWIDSIVSENELAPRTVCEIGCGAGAILHSLHQQWPEDVYFQGYEISAQAYELSQRYAAPTLQFTLDDPFTDGQKFDLVLVNDVVEHVEDCFAFLRNCRVKGRYQLYHIPLEITCTTALRDILGRGYQVGHIHHFSLASALAALDYTGHQVVDYQLTPVALDCAKVLRTRVMNCFRRLLPVKTATKLVGGYSLLALCTAK